MNRTIYTISACSLAALFLMPACGDDDGDGDTNAGSTGGTSTTSTTMAPTSSSTTTTTTGGSTSTTTTTTTTTTTDGTSTTTDGTGSTGGDTAEAGIAGGTFAPLGTYTGITGAALIVRESDGTSVSLQISGLPANTTAYGAHVHAQACADDDGGGHYKIDTSIGDTQESNELWPAFTSDDAGNGRVEITTDHLARADALSVVVHDPDSNNDKMACADLVVPSPVDPYVVTDATVTVLQAATDDGYGAMTATASIERNIDGSTVVDLTVAGLAADTTYPVHVHETNCSVSDGGGHYKIDYSIGGTEETNELWAPVATDGSGDGTGTYTVSTHIARAEAQSIVIHSVAGPRYACIDLD